MIVENMQLWFEAFNVTINNHRYARRFRDRSWIISNNGEYWGGTKPKEAAALEAAYQKMKEEKTT